MTMIRMINAPTNAPQGDYLIMSYEEAVDDVRNRMIKKGKT